MTDVDMSAIRRELLLMRYITVSEDSGVHLSYITARISARLFDMVMHRTDVYPNIVGIDYECESVYVSPISGFGNFPNLQYLSIKPEVYFSMSGIANFDVMCPRLIHVMVPGMVSDDFSSESFFAEVSLPPTIEFLSGRSSCKFVNLDALPKLKQLSAYFFTDTLIPAGLTDLRIVGSDEPLVVDASRMLRLSGSTPRQVTVGVCPQLKVVHLDCRVEFVAGTHRSIQYLFCPQETGLNLTSFPNLMYVSVPHTETYAAALGRRRRNLYVAPTSLALECGRQSFG